MIDIVAIINAAGPIVAAIASLIMNLAVYIKTNKIHQVVTQQAQNNQNATPPTPQQ